jgi:hypothetical protein
MSSCTHATGAKRCAARNCLRHVALGTLGHATSSCCLPFCRTQPPAACTAAAAMCQVMCLCACQLLSRLCSSRGGHCPCQCWGTLTCWQVRSGQAAYHVAGINCCNALLVVLLPPAHVVLPACTLMLLGCCYAHSVCHMSHAKRPVLLLCCCAGVVSWWCGLVGALHEKPEEWRADAFTALPTTLASMTQHYAVMGGSKCGQLRECGVTQAGMTQTSGKKIYVCLQRQMSRHTQHCTVELLRRTVLSGHV